MIFIYKEIAKKYVNLLTTDNIKKYAHNQGEKLTNTEAEIILTHINKYYNELLEGDTSSFTILKQNLRKDLFEKIELLYNDAKTKYL